MRRPTRVLSRHCCIRSRKKRKRARRPPLQLPQGPRASDVDQLLGVLKSEQKSSDYNAAADNLFRVGNAETLAALTAIAADEAANPYARSVALTTASRLDHMLGLNDPRLRATLSKMALDPSQVPLLQTSSIETLGGYSHSDVSPTLLKIAHDQNRLPSVRAKAAVAAGSSAIDVISEIACSPEGDSRARNAATKALSEHQGSRSAAALEQVALGAGRATPEQRAAALEGLNNGAHERALTLSKALLSDRNAPDQLRETALSLLIKNETPTDRNEMLTRLFRDKAEPAALRIRAAEKLATSGEPGVNDEMRRVVADPGEAKELRLAALDALTLSSEGKVSSAWRKIAEDRSVDEKSRSKAIQALGLAHDNESVRSLIKILASHKAADQRPRHPTQRGFRFKRSAKGPSTYLQ